MIGVIEILIITPPFRGYMSPPKRNIYLDEEDVRIWDKLPSGRRSELLRQLLVDSEVTLEIDEEIPEEWILRHKIAEAERLESHAESRHYFWDSIFYDMTNMIDELENKLREQYPDSIHFKTDWGAAEKTNLDTMSSEMWDVIVSQAEAFLQADKVFSSPSTANKYRIARVKNGKISVDMIDSDWTKPTTFTQMTLSAALSRLIHSGGERIRAKDFMASFSQICAVVNLHPRLEFNEADNQLWVAYTGVE